MTPMRRREFLKTVGAATASVAASRALEGQAATPERPNIVFILADDMGFGDVSSLNPESKIPTPNIDRMTRAGRYFTDAHSPSALCTPTRYGVLTGRYCFRTRVKNSVLWGFSRHLIEPERITVASLLKSVGYHTACIGKWHLGMDMPAVGGDFGQPHEVVDRRAFIGDVDWRGVIENGPVKNGFDEYYGIPASLDMYPYIWIEGDRFVGECTTEMDLLFTTQESREADIGDNVGPAEPSFVAEEVMPRIVQRTVDTIDRQSKNQPFFIYMSLTAPHIPIVPSEPFQGRSEIGPYGDFCIEVDDGVGRVLDALERNGVAENTLVIFTADNGCAPYIGVPEMNAEGHYPSYIYRGYKADIYEGGHRIPFIAQWPRRIPASTRSDEIISLTDLLATCAAITGADLPLDAGEDSVDISPALLGLDYDGPLREATVQQSLDGSFTIRQGRWKFEDTPSSGGYYRTSREDAAAQGLPPTQLYDLESDISERRNVVEEYPEVAERLKALLEQTKERDRSAPPLA